MAKWCDQGEARVCQILFGATAVDSNLYLGIYKSPTTEPDESAVVNDLTEPSGNGYARIALARGTWTTGSATSNASYAQQTFACTGGTWGACYGYFITTTSAGTANSLLAVEQFTNGPYTINDGDSIKITPVITVS